MLPNRIYTPAELRAMSRPDRARPAPTTDAGKRPEGPIDAERRWNLRGVVRRLFGRNGVRRSAPGTV